MVTETAARKPAAVQDRLVTVGAGRSGALLALVIGTVLVTWLLTQVTRPTVLAALAPGADAASMFAAIALAVAWVATLRLAVSAIAVLLANAPGMVGRAGHRVALAWSPRFARALVRAALGLTVAAGPLATSAAAFADGPELPTLDRVVTETAVPPTAVPPTAVPPTAASARPAVTTTTDSSAQSRAAKPRRPRPHQPPRTDTPQPSVVVVQPGDSLWTIADRALPPGHSADDVAKAWPRWYAANRDVIGPDPALIRPGQNLVAPD